ncbi:GGDEF domain-containing protein [Blastococcus sp. SYSU D00820]
MRISDPPARDLGWWWRGGRAAGFGRLLGLGAVAGPVLACAVLQPDEVDGSLLAAVAALHAAAAVAGFAVPWPRLSPWARLAFPLTAMAAVALTVAAVPGAASVYSGFFCLCFAYTGLFCPRRASWVLLGPALVAYLFTLPGLDYQVVVRATMLAVAWIVLGELLSLLSRRHGALVRQLRMDGATDPLTGLANRRGMEHFLAEAEAGDVLVVFDLDRFKQLNDEHGHAAGDRVLQAFGRVLQRELRTRDRAARSGGEEVVALLRCAEPRCGVEVTGRLRRALADACPGVTFSAGLAVVAGDRPVQAALEAADRAMYRAKDAGRDQVWLAGAAADGSGDVPAAEERVPAGAGARR